MPEFFRPHPTERDDARQRTVRALADAAARLAPRFRELRAAAWQALRDARVPEAEMTVMHRAVLSELEERARLARKRRRQAEAARTAGSTARETERGRQLLRIEIERRARQERDDATRAGKSSDR